jgi:hypothetical protein
MWSPSFGPPALFWCAVINGVIAVPPMIVIMLMAMQKRVMGVSTLPRPLWNRTHRLDAAAVVIPWPRRSEVELVMPKPAAK